MTRMTSSGSVYVRESSIVPSIGTVLVSWRSQHQAALEAASPLIAEKPHKGPSTFFPYALPMAEISPYNEPESKSGRRISLPKTYGSLFPFLNLPLSPVPLCCVCLRPTKASCTPARQEETSSLLD
jgi:hypothetical protein